MARLETDADGRSFVRLFKLSPLVKISSVRESSPQAFAQQGHSAMSTDDDDHFPTRTPSPTSSSGTTLSTSSSDGDNDEGWTTWSDEPGSTSPSWDDSTQDGERRPYTPDPELVRQLHRALIEQATTGAPSAGDDINVLVGRIGADAAFAKAAPISPGRTLCESPVRITATTQTVQNNISREFVQDFFQRWCDSPEKAHEAAEIFWRASHPRALALSLDEAPHIPAIVPGRLKLSGAGRAAAWRRQFGDSNVGTCPQCRQTMRFDRGGWTVAHLRAGSRGGSTTPDGVTIACTSCNTALGSHEAPVSWHAS